MLLPLLLTPRTLPAVRTAVRMLDPTTLQIVMQYRSRITSEETWREMLECVKAYRADTNKTVVPASFVVPSRAPYPRTSWGDLLGRRCSRVVSSAQRGKLDKSRVRALTDIGLDLRGANERGFEELVLSLEAYRKRYGDLNVATTFKVPVGDASWPRQSWGMRLGSRVNAVRSKGRYVEGRPERVARLDALGFVWTVPAQRFETLVAALRAFRAQHGSWVPKRRPPWFGGQQRHHPPAWIFT